MKNIFLYVWAVPFLLNAAEKKPPVVTGHGANLGCGLGIPCEDGSSDETPYTYKFSCVDSEGTEKSVVVEKIRTLDIGKEGANSVKSDPIALSAFLDFAKSQVVKSEKVSEETRHAAKQEGTADELQKCVNETESEYTRIKGQHDQLKKDVEAGDPKSKSQKRLAAQLATIAIELRQAKDSSAKANANLNACKKKATALVEIASKQETATTELTQQLCNTAFSFASGGFVADVLQKSLACGGETVAQGIEDCGYTKHVETKIKSIAEPVKSQITLVKREAMAT